MRALARAKGEYARVVKDPWYPVKKGWVITEDEKPPSGVPPVRPLPDWPYLEAVTRAWEENGMGLLAKSRQMMISWLFAWLNLWLASFHPGKHCLFQGKRREDVQATGTKGILGRARFIRNHLPPFLKPEVTGESVTYETYANGSTLEAIPEGSDVIRGKVISSLFMDEICFQETSEENWNAAVPAAQHGGKLWGVSTPNGHEFLYRQADPEMPWDHLTGGRQGDWPEIIPGLNGYITNRGVCLLGLHYTAHPPFNEVEWQQEARRAYTSTRKYMIERELDFTLVEGLGVFANEFYPDRHVQDTYIPDPNLPLHRGWDFGYNGQAVGFYQVANNGQIIWFDQVILKGVPLQKVIQEVKRRTTDHFHHGTRVIGIDERWKREEPVVFDYGDPSADAHNTKGETDRMTLSQHGIRLKTKKTTGRKRDLIEAMRQVLMNRSDGKPGMLVVRANPDMEHVIAGLAGAYHYAKAKDGKAEKELPHKDGLYDHIMDQCQYAIDHISPSRYGRPADVGTDRNWWKDTSPGIGTEGYEP
jgi:hypothetical protein